MKAIRTLLSLCLLFLSGCGMNRAVDGAGMVNSWENQLILTDWHSTDSTVSYRLHFEDDTGSYDNKTETAYGMVNLYEDDSLLSSSLYTIDSDEKIITACGGKMIGPFEQLIYVEETASEEEHLKGMKADGSEVIFERIEGG